MERVSGSAKRPLLPKLLALMRLAKWLFLMNNQPLLAGSGATSMGTTSALDEDGTSGSMFNCSSTQQQLEHTRTDQTFVVMTSYHEYPSSALLCSCQRLWPQSQVEQVPPTACCHDLEFNPTSFEVRGSDLRRRNMAEIAATATAMLCHDSIATLSTSSWADVGPTQSMAPLRLGMEARERRSSAEINFCLCGRFFTGAPATFWSFSFPTLAFTQVWPREIEERKKLKHFIVATLEASQ